MAKEQQHIILSTSDNDEKKISRKVVEKQRRRQMSLLYESLRSSLPFELTKGKHSASDVIDDAVNYIQFLEQKVNDLQIKRKNKEMVNSSLFETGTEPDHSGAPVKCVNIRLNAVGMEIVICSGLEEDSSPLSELLEILPEEGCDVVSYNSSRFNGRIFHNIKSEVKDLISLDLARLQRKLDHAILSRRLDIQHMDPGVRKARDFSKTETGGASTLENELSIKEEPLSLMRIRDFISLLLSYPVKLEEKGILKVWINAFSEWRTQLLSADDHAVTDTPWHILTRKALTCVEGLVPAEIISQIERGKRSIFSYNNDVIPDAILDLSVDLAVEQLIQTLFSGDYYARNAHHVRLSTRNFVEKRSVVKKITAALEDKHSMFGTDKDFHRAMWIDASKYESDAEIQIQEEINTMMAGVLTEEDKVLHVKEEMGSNRILVILIDGNNDKKLNPQKVHFPTGIVVFITTESSEEEEKGNEFTITCTADLNIRTQDHLLPWQVLCYFAGSSMVHLSSTIQRIAVQIVEECHGHLLAIVLVAESLKNVEDVKQWKLALSKVKNMNHSYDYIYQESDPIGIRRVMVNAFINCVWEGMNSTQKLCLEHCLFVHKIKVGVPDETLMTDWVSNESADTQDSRGTKLKFTGEEAEYDMRELLDRSVLLRRENSYVYLPTETYDVIKLLHTWNPSIIKHGAFELTEAPYIGRLRGLIRIELMENKICELPQSPDCPKLQVLLLQGNIELIDIPDSFFDNMPLLRYLDLSKTSIRDLPPSISKLTELKKFYLRSCDLFVELPPIIGQLKKLQELDLDQTLITHLPKEVGELINLKRLILCFDQELGYGYEGNQISSSTIIPPGVISNLTQLNYVSINVDPEDERWNENLTNILSEIFELERLETVNIYVPKAELLELIPAQKSLNFRLVVGHHKQRFISRVTPQMEQKFKHYECSVKFVNGVNVPNGVRMNLRRFRALYLDRHMTMKSLNDFELKNLQRLGLCILAECNEMETIVDGSYLHDEPALPNLEYLIVFYMKNLRSICEGPKPSFLYLKSIALHTCPKLSTIFTLDSLKNFSLLEELIVEDCPKVTTLINHNSSEHERSVFLPRLRMIVLLYLPELVNIFNGLHIGPYIEKMGFYNCPKLKSLSKSELSSKSLRMIRGELRWWETLEWNVEEWGDADRPNFLDLFFSSIDEDADLMTQLAGITIKPN
ncbi:hypothetical protein VNO77_01082 [Canavalia gladiata]|uniref:BHLH domain-containing protein n=1 Tax=Canavalia gladiata TaxID=3824 RepID=A0AAN9R1W7_CANGL